MINIEKGRYWDRPWSLVDGCTPCSPGCDHCWSASMAHRFDGTKDTGMFLTDEGGQRNDSVRGLSVIVDYRPL